MKILTVLIVSFMMGCAITLTEEESALCKGNVTCLTEALEEKTARVAYESENRRILKREHIVAELQRCFDSGMVVVQVKRSGSTIGRHLRDRHGIIHLPRHAMIQDYRCSTGAVIADDFKRAGLLR